MATDSNIDKSAQSKNHFFRFHLPHTHLHSLFGDDWFALKAEKFARFFGTPVFLIGQTIIVAAWILVNVAGWTQFDIYPFILLNLAFSLQAAYAAPLILLAQTRQADRDKCHAEADAQHREDIARMSEERQTLAVQQTTMLLELVKQNTDLTQTIKSLTERVEGLTAIIHRTGSSGMVASRFPLRVVSGHAPSPPAEDGSAWDDRFGGLRTKGSCRGHIAPAFR